MRVTDYTLWEVPPRWLFLRIETEDGAVGWGEPVVEGRAHTTRAAVEELMDTVVVGADPTDIQDLWSAMYRGGFYRGGPVLMSAIAGIDQALWDLKGRTYGAPVHDLLGGAAREKVRVYQWIGGDRPADVIDQARERQDAGLTAVKMNATPEFRRIETRAAVEAAVDRIRSVREATGDEFDVAVDFHGRVAKSMAPKLAAALEPHDPMFVEEPVLPENGEGFAAVDAATTTPIATGERLFSRWDYKEFFEQGAVDVVQPDLSHAGGISEVHKIASMAEAYDVALAPHCPLGPIAFASSLQVDAWAPNALIQEQSLGIHYNEGSDLLDYLADPDVFDYADGYVDVPGGPGLGVEVDVDAVEAQAGDVDWHGPIWRHEDGSVAEW